MEHGQGQGMCREVRNGQRGKEWAGRRYGQREGMGREVRHGQGEGNGQGEGTGRGQVGKA